MDAQAKPKAKAKAAKRPPPLPDDEEHELPILLMKWDNPDYAAIIRQRIENLKRLREQPEKIPLLKAYYRDHLADFINDWGVTYDPRNAEIGLPTLMPFVLFPRQREWVEWVIQRWKARSPGLCEKSRDMGVSWLGMGLSCGLCCFHDGIAVGVGSRKGEYVDKIGQMKPLLPKARMFMDNVPVEFRAGYEAWRDAPFMRLNFPETGSMIGGEGGDDIGRGDRTSLYLVDEYAHFERPELTEASLSQTTNCRIDMSSVRGMNNPFARKRWGGKVDVFVFDWHDDPRKNQQWYEKQCQDLDPVVVAQEIDRDYSASVTGIVIPGTWVRSAIDALEKLGLVPSGERGLAMDVADEGTDKNALCGNHGVEINYLEEWSGKGSDIFASVERTFDACDAQEIDNFRYDQDGLGADVRGDARVINAQRVKEGKREIRVTGYRGSAKVLDPEGVVDGTIGREGDKGRTNEDYFYNRKAQAWWSVRKRFERTHRWVEAVMHAKLTGQIVDPKAVCNPNDIISISSKAPGSRQLYLKLTAELSQPTYSQSIGKILINKKPDKSPSPNLADALVIKMADGEPGPVIITGSMLAQIGKTRGLSRIPRRRGR